MLLPPPACLRIGFYSQRIHTLIIKLFPESHLFRLQWFEGNVGCASCILKSRGGGGLPAQDKQLIREEG